MINAKITTTDGELVVDLDATTWFDQASDDVICEVIESHFAGGSSSSVDPLFWFYRSTAANEVWRYWTTHPDRYGDNPVGWNITVDETDVLNWATEHRPQLVSRLSIADSRPLGM
jgi:hypothetical protein